MVWNTSVSGIELGSPDLQRCLLTTTLRAEAQARFTCSAKNTSGWHHIWHDIDLTYIVTVSLVSKTTYISRDILCYFDILVSRRIAQLLYVKKLCQRLLMPKTCAPPHRKLLQFFLSEKWTLQMYWVTYTSSRWRESNADPLTCLHCSLPLHYRAEAQTPLACSAKNTCVTSSCILTVSLVWRTTWLVQIMVLARTYHVMYFAILTFSCHVI